MESVSKIRELLSESVWIGSDPSTDAETPPPGSFIHIWNQLTRQWLDALMFSGLDAALGDLGLDSFADVSTEGPISADVFSVGSHSVYRSRSLQFDIGGRKAGITLSVDIGSGVPISDYNIHRVNGQTYVRRGSVSVYCSFGSTYSHKTFSFDDYATAGEITSKLAREIADICKRLQEM